MLHIETPEDWIIGAASEERQLEQIKSRIAFLTKELEDLNNQLQQERKRTKRRQLETMKQQLEYELRFTRYQEEHLINSVFSIESKEA